VNSRLLTVFSLITTVSLAGCSSKPANQDSAAKPQTAAQATSGQPESQPGMPGGSAASTAQAGSAERPAVETFTGTVAETMNGSNYTYVRVKADKREIWAASATFKVAVGDKVVVPLEMPMENFESAALKRTFPVIYFAPQIVHEGEALPQSQAPQMMSSHTATGQQAQPVGKVDPAPGGMTVADVWAKRKTLGGQSVTVRGKIVKFNGGIMGRNWIHIQDGTGSDKDGTYDLTLTSDAEAKVGDVVTITGKVAIDKDFGAGYNYAVIVEGAKIVVK